ncbi:Mu transposase C-terminal domain-containing protein [Rhodococcus artemisiae]|uniref:Mu transposase C-terminal domain-containing protein n=1 Tax=Rhodococcus artemisiae TaxID=714159 RepID=A0ABU7LFR5_9NOCA|nr:Mu transposase C-terminal domain-containing protein [Rhodococcus artemisiae]MEE2060112.1 Mu transposase C-terminal domain-containing protein [Rhodococcus artemisiae]
MFTLEDDRRHRTITTKGIAFGRDRHYIADWMVGLVGAGVRIRYMPHHTGEIEVFDADTGTHLGTAVIADAASAEDRARVLQARARKARQLRSDLAAAERERRPVCGVDGAGTRAAARCDDRGRGRRGTGRRGTGRRTRRRHGAMARPDLIPLGPPPANWRLPVDPNDRAELNRNEDHR